MTDRRDPFRHFGAEILLPTVVNDGDGDYARVKAPPNAAVTEPRMLDCVKYLALTGGMGGNTTLQAASPVDAIRHFNRFYTRKIGVLNAGLLDSPFSLTEVRVLYELAHRPGATANDLVRDLDLDAGYLSRLLARFAQQRLILKTRSPRDGRQTHLKLSGAGRRKFAALNARSSQQADRMIQHLPAAEQHRLAGMMHSIRHLLAATESKAASEVQLRDPRPGELGWVVERHGALYAHEYGWNQEFEGLVARIVAEFVASFDAHRERCWIAELDGQPVGSVFLARKSDTVAKLRLLLVEPIARGRGVGHRLVAACIEFARLAGYRKIELWTNSVLHAARRIYEQAGFRLVASQPHRSFGHDLVGQTWELKLDAGKPIKWPRDSGPSVRAHTRGARHHR